MRRHQHWIECVQYLYRKAKRGCPGQWRIRGDLKIQRRAYGARFGGGARWFQHGHVRRDNCHGEHQSKRHRHRLTWRRVSDCLHSTRGSDRTDRDQMLARQPGTEHFEFLFRISESSRSSRRRANQPLQHESNAQCSSFVQRRGRFNPGFGYDHHGVYQHQPERDRTRHHWERFASHHRGACCSDNADVTCVRPRYFGAESFGDLRRDL